MRMNVCAGFQLHLMISFIIGGYVGYVGYRGKVNTHGSEQPRWYLDDKRESLERSLYNHDYGLVEQMQIRFRLNKYLDVMARAELSQSLMNIWYPTTPNPPDIKYRNIQTGFSLGLSYTFQ